jgi:hypothetical protein
MSQPDHTQGIDPLLAPLGIGYSFHVVYTYNFKIPIAYNTTTSLLRSRYRDIISPHLPVKPTRVPARADLDPPQRRKSLGGYEDLLWERLVDFVSLKWV